MVTSREVESRRLLLTSHHDRLAEAIVPLASNSFFVELGGGVKAGFFMKADLGRQRPMVRMRTEKALTNTRAGLQMQQKIHDVFSNFLLLTVNVSPRRVWNFKPISTAQQ